MTRIVNAKDVSMEFKAVKALSHVNLHIEQGETVALLGHNGAGKTTLIRIMLGFQRPTTGTIDVAGHAAGSKSARQMISYLPENIAFQKMLTGREIVSFYATLKGAPRDDVNRALKDVELAEAADRRVETYSKGMRQRLGLAQAFVGTPKLLLLDEPTSGLDPISRQHFYALIAKLASQGTAILLSSHGLSELEARTDRIAILRKGELVANAPVAELQKAASLPIRIRVRSKEHEVEAVHRALGGKQINCVSVELMCDIGEKMKYLATIHGLGDAVDDIDVSAPTLDEIYRYYSAEDAVEPKAGSAK